MYQISRAIYRRLAPRVVPGPGDPSGRRGRQQLLGACEAMMTRMAEDRDYVAHPERTLFNEIRGCFSLPDQLMVYSIVKRHVELADDYLARLPGDVTAFGNRRQCRASTRRGTPCRREPLPGRAYCPSHKHLEELVLAA
jgi:hypothetical protein